MSAACDAASRATWRGAIALACIAALACAESLLAQPAPVVGPPALRGLVRDATGPVAGASVRAHRRITDPSVTDYSAHEARSATDGSFVIEGVEPGVWYDLDVEAPWHRKGTTGGTTETSLIEVTLVGLGAIKGRVVADAIGLFASCRAVAHSGYPDGHAIAVRNTRFAIDDLLPGTYECKVRGRRLVSDVLPVEVKAGSATRVTITITTVARPRISVEVVDAVTRRPVTGARVGWGSSFSMSGSHGRLTLEIPSNEPLPGGRTEVQAPLRVESDGFETALVNVPDPPPATLTIALVPSPRVRGRIVDADGRPAAGAEVLLDDTPWIRADETGYFEVARPFSQALLRELAIRNWQAQQRERQESGELPTEFERIAARFLGEAQRDVSTQHSLYARLVHDGITESATVILDGLPSSEVVVTLTRVERVQIGVTARDPSGPIAGASVDVDSPTASHSGLTDASGRFLSPMLDAGDYNVRMQRPGSSEMRYQKLSLRPGDHPEIDVLMGDGWTIDGHVMRAGRPVEGARVGWYAEGASDDGGRTDATGAFHVGPVPRDRWEALVRAEGMATMVQAGSAPIVLDIGWVTLRGRVVDGAQPVAGARISLDSATENVSPILTNSAGEFSLERAPCLRACDLIVRKEGGPSRAVGVRTIAEGVQGLGDIQVRSRMVHGRASVPGGGFVPMISMRMLLPNGGLLDTVFISFTKVGEDFDIELPPGDTRYVALIEGLAPIAGVLREGEAPRWRFARGASLEIEVRSPVGASIIGEARLVSHERLPPLTGDAALTAHGDDHGIVRFEPLPPGHAVVEVRGGGRLGRIEVDLVVGKTTRVVATLH